MNESMIVARYALTATDFFKVLIWYQWKRSALIIGVVLSLMLLLGLAVIRPTPEEPYKRLPLYFAAVITPIFIVSVSYFGLRRQAKKLEAISEEVEMTADPIEMQIATASSTARIKWNRLNKVVEINDYFVFFPQDKVFFVLPKHGLGADFLESLRLILKNSLGNRAKLKY